jgi:Phage gp6-like head-tail connector protein
MHSVLEIISEAPESAGPDLISLDDLKLALGITGTTEDAALQAQITMQSRLIADYCNRRFGLAEALETFTYDRYENILARQAVTLSLYPVVEVTEVLSAGLTGTDHSFDPASGRLWVTSGLCWVDTVAVSYSGGYDLPEEAPARLQQAVIQAVNDTRTTGSRDAGIREVQHGDTRIAYFTPSMAAASSGYLSATVIDLIRPHRRLHVA